MSEYKKVCEIIEQEEARVENAKRPSYTVGNEDVLHNFKRDAELQGIDPLQNLLSHYLKQVAAIVSYVRFPNTKPSEPLLSRVVDARVYPKLLLALAQDQRGVMWSNVEKETIIADERATGTVLDGPNWYAVWCGKDKSGTEFPGYMT